MFEKKPQWMFAISITLFLLANCGEGEKGTQGGNESSKADQPQCSLDDPECLGEAHYDANNCEIFIDRAYVYMSSHAYTELKLYVKVLKDRLDSPIKRAGVRFLAEENGTALCDGSSYHGSQCTNVGEWKEESLDAFPNADDYFSKQFFLHSDYNPTLKYQLAFFVETENGTYLWAKSKDSQDFFLDSSNVYEMQKNGLGGIYTDDVSRLTAIADMPDFVRNILNPQACR